MNITESLKNFPDLYNSDIISFLSPISIIKIFEKDQIIMNIGDDVKFVPLVIAGSIRVVKQDESGKEILLYYIESGQTCINTIFYSTISLKSSIKATTNNVSKVLLFPSKYVNDLKSYPKWNDFILSLYQRRFEELIHFIDSLAFEKIDKRILNFIAKKSEIEQNLDIFITHQQIADEVGTAREVVSRVLKQFENEGKILIGRGQIKLINIP